MLELDTITAGYGDTTVLRNVSLRLGAGRVGALFGPNGAGKTTLLRTASGLLPLTSGTVRIDGESVTSCAPHQRAWRGMCHVPEGRGIFPSLTVRENVAAFASRSARADAFDRAVEAFPRLRDRANQVAGTMSGGEQQMVALSRAWVQRPRMALIDEPSLGLAPMIVDAVYEFLKKLAASGTAMLIVEQYADMALALADDAHVVIHGEIVYSGPATSVDRHILADHYLAARD